MLKLHRSVVLALFVIGLLSVNLAHAQDAKPDPCTCAAATAQAATMAAKDNSSVSFEIILPNARGARSFIDSAAAGAARALKEPGVKGKIIETSGVQEHDAAVRRAVQDKPSIVITIAVDPSTIDEIVQEFPDQKFAAQETFFPKDPTYKNLAIYNIFTHENSYLAGVAAGMLSKSKIVGAVGGGDFPGINLFIVGYEEGVKSVCKDCKTVRAYVGGSNPFSDPVKAKELANGMYSQGADIIYQVAGRSGEGVLQAAKESGKFAIGVDSNQDDLYPGTVIVSAMKRVDNAVYAFVKSAVDNTYKAGSTNVGLKEGFAGLSWDVGVCSRTFDKNGPKDMVDKLPAVRAAIDAARAKILSGDIKVTNALLEPPK